MLSLIQKLFGTSKARAQAPESTTQQHFEPNSAMPVVEVAHLRLDAILARLPDELKPLVLKMPEASATVALPISTIVKQLPSGAVKVSLATLHRQAPVGVLAPLPPGDKRMVDVPLAEVFRHIKPTVFKRRNDQKTSDALESEFSLFGDAENPYQIAPTAPEPEAAPEPPAVALPVPAPVVPDLPRGLKLDAVPSAPAPLVEAAVAPAPVATTANTVFRLAHSPAPLSAPQQPAPLPEVNPPESAERRAAAPAPVAPPVSAPAAPPIPPPATTNDETTSIVMPMDALSAGWPEPIRHELAALNGSARVSLPKAEVTAGLTRGRVTFTWGQIRGWMDPAAGESTSADESTELILPLRVVAPLFLPAARPPKQDQHSTDFGADIPALFNPAHAPTAPAAEPVLETPKVLDVPAPVEMPVAAEALPVAESAAELPEPVPEPVLTVGELFGQPEKTDWTPAELVSNLAKLGGVSGAVVALQEGLLVAHSLPADVKSEAIAAFLPQLFARLNIYSAEMKLGDVDDLLFTTHGAHCQIYRLGFLYFAVLGKPGETLPWNELRLVADELARQTQNS